MPANSKINMFADKVEKFDDEETQQLRNLYKVANTVPSEKQRLDLIKALDLLKETMLYRFNNESDYRISLLEIISKQKESLHFLKTGESPQKKDARLAKEFKKWNSTQKVKPFTKDELKIKEALDKVL
ncbi:hypothetical protein ACFLY7_00900 [Patescibacteria group bacterium]